LCRDLGLDILYPLLAPTRYSGHSARQELAHQQMSASGWYRSRVTKTLSTFSGVFESPRERAPHLYAEQGTADSPPIPYSVISPQDSSFDKLGVYLALTLRYQGQGGQVLCPHFSHRERPEADSRLLLCTKPSQTSHLPLRRDCISLATS